MNKYSPMWKSCVAPKSCTLRDVLGVINKSGLLTAALLDSDGKLVAIFTDSDVRRAILNGADLDSLALPWANSKPFTESAHCSQAMLFAISTKNGFVQIPLIDSDGRLVDIYLIQYGSGHDSTRNMQTVEGTEASCTGFEPCAVFILAGGLGTRLRSVVSDSPKPLARVGNQPILRTVINHAAGYGFRDFFISVNYLADHIESHIAQEGYSSLNIKVVREPLKLGTAGSIGLIRDEVNGPILVLNADVLTTVPLDRMLRAFTRSDAEIFCAVRPYKVTIPFGVASIEADRIVGVIEKPTHTYFVNAGIYILSPSIYKKISPDRFLDMPDLITASLKNGIKVEPFVLHEYWIDIGSPADFMKANKEFETHFGDS